MPPLAIVRTSEISVRIVDPLVYSTGLLLTTSIGGVPMSEPDIEPIRSLYRSGREHLDGELLVGIRMSDGRETTNCDIPSAIRSPVPPFARMRLIKGSTRGGRWTLRWWLAPFPATPSDLAVFFEWPRRGVSRSEVVISKNSLRNAREHVRTLRGRV